MPYVIMEGRTDKTSDDVRGVVPRARDEEQALEWYREWFLEEFGEEKEGVLYAVETGVTVPQDHLEIK